MYFCAHQCVACLVRVLKKKHYQIKLNYYGLQFAERETGDSIWCVG